MKKDNFQNKGSSKEIKSITKDRNLPTKTENNKAISSGKKKFSEIYDGPDRNLV